MLLPNTTLLLSVLISALIIAMLLNHISNQQQQRKRQRVLTTQQLKQQAAQLLNALSILQQLESPTAVTQLLNAEALKILSRLDRLSPEMGLIEKLDKQSRIGAAPQQRIHLESDRAMKKAHRAIRFAAHFIHQRHLYGGIPKAAHDESRRQLRWIDSKMVIDTHIKIGKRLLDNNKPNVAVRRFRRAKTAIARLPNLPNRHQLMTQANQLIEQSISLSTRQSRPKQ